MPQTSNFNTIATQCRRSLIFQTMNAIRSNNVSLKYQRLTPLGCKDIGFTKTEFVAKTQFLSFLFNGLLTYLGTFYGKLNTLLVLFLLFKDNCSWRKGHFIVQNYGTREGRQTPFTAIPNFILLICVSARSIGLPNLSQTVFRE